MTTIREEILQMNWDWGAIIFVICMIIIGCIVGYMIYLNDLADPYILKECEWENYLGICVFYKENNQSDIKIKVVNVKEKILLK